ncbi:MAG: hypothetical protein WA885_04855 [Phormidesmis sp.]
MTKQTIATLLAEEVNAPSQSAQPISESAAIAPVEPVHLSTAIAPVSPQPEGLFAESKQLWDELVAFDRENELSSKVGAQLWRLTKIVAKPIFIVTWKGVEAAVITAVDPDKRAAFIERFSRAKEESGAEVSLKAVNEPFDEVKAEAQ